MTPHAVMIAVLQHSAAVTPGLLSRQLPAGARIVRLDRNEDLPDLDGLDGIVVLGGIMGAYDEDEFPFLVAEKALLAKAVEGGVPVLGICLGCQLLAESLGGAAYRAALMEFRFGSCRLTPAGAGDAVARHLVDPVLSFHQDTWDLPPGATLLAETAAFPQAFRLGSALGIQPHPEATPNMVARWLAAFPPDRIAAVADGDAVLAAMEANRRASAATAERLFAAWLRSLP